MATLTQTPANVGIGSLTTPVRPVQVGEAVTQGQPGIRDATSGKYLQADGSDADKDEVAGIFLTAAALDGYALLALPGSGGQKSLVNLGATLTVGKAYYLHGSKGVIGEESDLGTGDYVTFLGIAETAELIDLQPRASGQAKP